MTLMMPYYRELQQLSQSECKVLLTSSGKEYLHWKKNGIPGTAAMQRGEMVHDVFLENVALGDKYAIDRWPSLYGKARTAKGYQEYKADLIATGKPWVREEDLEPVEGMLQSLEAKFRKHFKAGEGDPEVPIANVELVPRVNCKGKIDWLPRKHFIYDLKTTSFNLDDRMMHSFLNFHFWKLQAAFYHDLIYQTTGQSRPFVFFIVQDKPPYPVRKIVLEPHTRTMAEGRALYLEAAELYKKYRDLPEDQYPDYTNYVVSEIEKRELTA